MWQNKRMKRLIIILLALVLLPLARPTRVARAAALPARDTIIVHTEKADTVYVRFDTLHPAPAIRTNLIYGASASPNIGLEFPLGSHLTIGANLGMKTWPRWLPWDNDRENPRKWRHILVVPELRWWPGQIYDRWFFGTDLIWTHYNVGAIKFPFGMYPDAYNYRLQGDLYALGLFAGYSWHLTDNLRLEAEAGIAAGFNNADKYDCAYCGAKLGKAQPLAIVPKLGLNIAYDFSKKYTKQEIIDIIRHPEPPVVEPEPFEPVLMAVEEWKGVAGILEKDNPVLRPSSEYRPYTPDMILRKMDGPLYVHFPLDKTVLQPDFRGNSGTLDKIVDITRQIMADTTSSVSCIQIVGLASIEGVEKHNRQLADGRAIALQRYVQENLNLPDSLFESTGGGEAWSEFRDQVNDIVLAGGAQGITREQAAKVLEIIDSEPDPAKREQKLRAMESGRLWPLLKSELLSDQRNSGYIRIYYDYVPDETARTINNGIAAINRGDYTRAMELLEGVKDDPRCTNALAVALWYNGREQEAVNILRKAAVEGDTAAARNLAGMERWLEYEMQRNTINVIR